jgi:hypothetical protein
MNNNEKYKKDNVEEIIFYGGGLQEDKDCHYMGASIDSPEDLQELKPSFGYISLALVVSPYERPSENTLVAAYCYSYGVCSSVRLRVLYRMELYPVCK